MLLELLTKAKTFSYFAAVSKDTTVKFNELHHSADAALVPCEYHFYLI